MDVDSSMVPEADHDPAAASPAPAVGEGEQQAEAPSSGGRYPAQSPVQQQQAPSAQGQQSPVVGPRLAPTYSAVSAIIEKKEDGPGPRCGHTLTAVEAVGEEGTPGYIGPRLILFGGATALEGNSAASGTPSSAGNAGILVAAGATVCGGDETRRMVLKQKQSMMIKYLGKFQIVHVPETEPHDLLNQPTESVFASAIDLKHANQIVRQLNKVAPLENLRHVKRIQKKNLEGGQVRLSVILCLASEGDNQLDRVPQHLQELISSYQLSPFITKVCKYAATSKEEWQEQCKIWPTSYHPRTYNIDGITGFSEEDSQSIFKFMQSAIELSKSDGMVVNAAVIVDPSSKQIISSASDQVFAWSTRKENSSINSSCNIKPEFSSSNLISNKFASHEPSQVNSCSNQLKQPYTGVACLYPWQWSDQQSNPESSFSWHPLRHAAIVAIESSAARDRFLFPSEGNNEQKYLELAHENSSWTSSTAKRQKTDYATVDDDDQSNAHSQNSDQLSARPYLCTGYDIYLVWEPCTMCAMALVHQRIRRIFYAFPNPNAGALGSVQRLQGEKSLNHHYAVFRVLLPQETLHKCNTEVTEIEGDGIC